MEANKFLIGRRFRANERYFKPIYRCPVCLTEHKTQAAATKCANSTPKPKFAPGDIVRLAHPQYGWFDGDKRWVIKRGPEKFHERELYHFYHVVTAVDLPRPNVNTGRRAHRPRYHVVTLAVKNGMTPGWNGYTYDSGHYDLVLVKNPPAHIAEAAAGLIGLRSERLL